MQVVPTLADRQSQTHNARQAPRCRHIKANGEPCRAAANRRHDLCYFHQNAQASDKPERLPVLEDANAIQVALMIIMDGLYRYHIPHRLRLCCSMACRSPATTSVTSNSPPQPTWS